MGYQQQRIPNQMMNIPNTLTQNTNVNMPYAPFINNSSYFHNHQKNFNISPNQNQLFNQIQRNNTNNNNLLYNPHIQQQLNFYQTNIRPQHQLQTQQPVQATNNSQIYSMGSQATETPGNNLPPLNHLISAFRTGMLGLEALPKRVDGTNQIKYRQIPSYSDDVKWLWNIAVKLGQ